MFVHLQTDKITWVRPLVGQNVHPRPPDDSSGRPLPVVTTVTDRYWPKGIPPEQIGKRNQRNFEEILIENKPPHRKIFASKTGGPGEKNVSRANPEPVHAHVPVASGFPLVQIVLLPVGFP